MASEQKLKTRFGQLVIGPPGSGKTTYVAAMSELLKSMGRKVSIINLDPANENMNYEPDVDIANLIRVEEVMDELSLGPNGGLVYAMQFLMKNLDWLKDKLDQLPNNNYLMIDCPGQVELYTVDQSMKNHDLKTSLDLLKSGFLSCSGEKFVCIAKQPSTGLRSASGQNFF